jgi:hypothetical protein
MTLLSTHSFRMIELQMLVNMKKNGLILKSKTIIYSKQHIKIRDWKKSLTRGPMQQSEIAYLGCKPISGLYVNQCHKDFICFSGKYLSFVWECIFSYNYIWRWWWWWWGWAVVKDGREWIIFLSFRPSSKY